MPKYTYSNGTTVVGKYLGPLPGATYTGPGTESYKDGSIYEGNFVNSVMQGKGKFYFADGSVLDGDF